MDDEPTYDTPATAEELLGEQRRSPAVLVTLPPPRLKHPRVAPSLRLGAPTGSSSSTRS